MTQVVPHSLFDDVKSLIASARARAAASVNAELSLLYWQVGRRIRDDVLRGERGEYGQEVIGALARKLTAVYGRGWSEQQLRHCLRVAEIFPDEAIFSAARRELSWTHIKILMYVDDTLKREFYLELCRLERWSSRQLQERIQSMLFERSALSRKPTEMIQQELSQLRDTQQLTPGLLLKDPYLLDFLGLNDRYLERDLEDAILREMEQFLLELGAGFAFVARQKRLQIDDDDFYLDLLFYNRKLKRLVAIELKLGAFKAEYGRALQALNRTISI
jgi:predicted nuclease of restriction endonuclease-like (RecB) superfamily